MSAPRAVEFDLANERVVLATMAKDVSIRRRLAYELRPGEFSDEKHRALFGAIAQLTRAGLDCNEDTLADFAAGSDFGGFGYFRALVEDYEPNANVDHHVHRMRLDATKYSLLAEHVPALAAACQDPRVGPEELRRLASTVSARVDGATQSFELGGSDLRDAYYAEMRFRAVVGGVVEGTGWPIFDRGFTRGFVPGLSVLVGRPAHGKTTWVSNLLRKRVDRGKPTYVFGWEMQPLDYVDMMVSAETGILAEDLAKRVGSFSSEEKRMVTTAVERFSDRRLLRIERNPFSELPKPDKPWLANPMRIDHLEAVIRREAGQFPLFVLDVVGKLLVDRRPDAISEALVRVREIALGAQVHVMLVHHLNRDAAEGRPTLEGIKGSGAFEEEADLIFGIDRPILRASAGRRRKMNDVLDVHVLKQRKGPAPLCVRYQFDGARYLLTNEVEVDVAMLDKDSEEGTRTL